MDLKFKTRASDLNSALDIVAIVPPKTWVAQGTAGFLFVVKKGSEAEEGKGRCYVYSQDSLRAARADFEITDVEGEGSFFYPVQHVESFKFAEGDITLAAHSEGDQYTVRYDLGSGAGGERTTCDPAALPNCDKDLEEAGNEREFPAAILREAIGMSRPFIAKPGDGRAEEQYKTLQIFDSSNEATAKGDGNAFAANGIQAYYFYCDAFKGKPLAVHGQYIPCLSAFLAKAAGNITIKTGKSRTFVIDSAGHVFGWTHHTQTHQKFSYYALKSDQIVLSTPKVRTLNQLHYVKTELGNGRDKIKIMFDQAASTLRFEVVDSKSKATSLPVDVQVVNCEGRTTLETHANVDQLLELIDGPKAEQVELRAAILAPSNPQQKERVMLRTIDEFWLDGDGKVVAGSGVPEGKEPQGAFRCKVTRFMPCKE